MYSILPTGTPKIMVPCACGQPSATPSAICFPDCIKKFLCAVRRMHINLCFGSIQGQPNVTEHSNEYFQSSEYSTEFPNEVCVLCPSDQHTSRNSGSMPFGTSFGSTLYRATCRTEYRMTKKYQGIEPAAIKLSRLYKWSTAWCASRETCRWGLKIRADMCSFLIRVGPAAVIA